MNVLPVQVRVIKFGGSLFGSANAKQKLLYWLDRQQPSINVLLAGGGRPVDQVRILQKQIGFDDIDSHWLAIKQLNHTARILAAWIPHFELIENLDAMAHRLRIESSGVPGFVFAPLKWLRDNSTLPMNWDSTSDSIAAEIAQACAASFGKVELVLLKSRSLRTTSPFPHCRIPIRIASEDGLVDQNFESMCGGLDALRIVNIQSEPFETMFFATTSY